MFSFDGRHFLGIAQGVTVPQAAPRCPHEVDDLRWTAAPSSRFRSSTGAEGYNWHYSEIERRFLAYADHTSPSLVYRWDGTRFAAFQGFSEQGGRAFSSFGQGDSRR